MREVIIIGAGLSGLTAAYFLHKAGIKPLVIEARDRWGGRVHTVTAAGNATPVEMGATWFTDNHTHLKHLLKELGLSFYPQYQKGVGVFENSLSEEAQLFQIPPSGEASYRIAGGSSTLTDKLVEHIGSDQVVLDTPIAEISEQQDHIDITSSSGVRFSCKKLVITVPPRLMAQKVAFMPELPETLTHIMENTHTWMGESIKFAVEYAKPFWRQRGYAGVIFSHAGIAREIHDHCNFEETHYALKGFLSDEAFAFSPEKRETKVIEQLRRLLGKEASDYLSYTEMVWKEEVYTYTGYDKYVMPHQHNGHPLYTRPLMNGKLFLAGTETSPYSGGYLDGAVYSGLATAKVMLHRMNSSI